MKSNTLQPIALVHSPYREKFGIPRQPGLATAAEGYLHMLPPYDDAAAFNGIEGFSHIWVTFGFHACAGESRLRVRPPRLGGNQEIGVFASRSPFRPNHLGLSALRFLGLQATSQTLRVHVSGLDILHGTPVYDIKPYLPYADCIADASGGFAATPPQACLQVVFSNAAATALQQEPAVRTLIEQAVALDPRPAYQRKTTTERLYGIRLANYDVRWRVQDDTAHIEAVISV